MRVQAAIGFGTAVTCLAWILGGGAGRALKLPATFFLWSVARANSEGHATNLLSFDNWIWASLVVNIFAWALAWYVLLSVQARRRRIAPAGTEPGAA